jgi:hypothetical protein
MQPARPGCAVPAGQGLGFDQAVVRVSRAFTGLTAVRAIRARICGAIAHRVTSARSVHRARRIVAGAALRPETEREEYQCVVGLVCGC